jgi:hypothetical protein
MDEVLSRKGILQYQDRMLKIIKFLIKLERNSINYVSNFSANNQEMKMQADFNQGNENSFFLCFLIKNKFNSNAASFSFSFWFIHKQKRK